MPEPTEDVRELLRAIQTEIGAGKCLSSGDRELVHNGACDRAIAIIQEYREGVGLFQLTGGKCGFFKRGKRVGARYCAGYAAPVGACEGGSMSTEGLEKQAMAEGMKEHAELVKYRQALEGIIDVTHMMVEIARKALAE